MTQDPKRQINWKKNLLFIWLSQLLTLVGFAGVMPFIPIFLLEKFGIQDINTRGQYMAMFNFFGMLSFAVCTPFWGYIADKFGRKIMLIRASFCGAVIIPCMAFVPSVGWLIFVRFVSSMFSGTINAAQTLIASTTPKEHHGFALGTLSSAVWSGNMIGFLLGGVVVHYFGYTTAFLTCGGMYLLSGLLVTFFVEENFRRIPEEAKAAVAPGEKTIPSPLPEKRKGIFAILPAYSAQIYWILVLFFIISFARRFDEVYLALQVESIGGTVNSELYTSWISAAAALGGIVAGAGMGYLADKFSPGVIAVPAVILSALFVLGQGFAPCLAALGIFRFMSFVTAGGLEPLFLTMLTKISPEGKRGAIIGWTASFRNFGTVTAALIGGSIIGHWGIKSVYISAAAAFILILPLLIKILKTQNKPAVL